MGPTKLASRRDMIPAGDGREWSRHTYKDEYGYVFLGQTEIGLKFGMQYDNPHRLIATSTGTYVIAGLHVEDIQMQRAPSIG